MAVEDTEDHSPRNLMASILESIREAYVEEHGEEPSEEFIRRARNEIVHNLASKERDEHRDIYEALAKE